MENKLSNELRIAYVSRVYSKATNETGRVLKTKFTICTRFRFDLYCREVKYASRGLSYLLVPIVFESKDCYMPSSRHRYGQDVYLVYIF